MEWAYLQALCGRLSQCITAITITITITHRHLLGNTIYGKGIARSFRYPLIDLTALAATFVETMTVPIRSSTDLVALRPCHLDLMQHDPAS